MCCDVIEKTKKATKRVLRKCQHEMIHKNCRICNSSRLCKHGIIRNHCRECTPSIVCKHGRNRYKCKECKPSLICEHRVWRASCKSCTPSGRCKHGLMRSSCTICTPKLICEHGAHRKGCNLCNPQLKCTHGLMRKTCKKCSPHIMCQHGPRKTHCRICTPSIVCDHGITRLSCKQCTPSVLCEHGTRHQDCKLCFGSSFCEHGKRRYYCLDCGSPKACISCNMVVLTKKGSKCTMCEPRAGPRARVKEARVANQLLEWSDKGEIVKFTTWNKSIADTTAAACGRVRPDFLWALDSHTVILEVDEQQHLDRDPRCELLRVQDLLNSCNGAPLKLIRYNPDAFKISGVTRRTTQKERIDLLFKVLKDALESPCQELLSITYICFDCTTCQSSCFLSHVATYLTPTQFAEHIDQVAPLQP